VNKLGARLKSNQRIGVSLRLAIPGYQPPSHAALVGLCAFGDGRHEQTTIRQEGAAYATHRASRLGPVHKRADQASENF